MPSSMVMIWLGSGCAQKVIGLLDRVFQQIERCVSAFRRVVGILVPAFVIPLDKLLVERPFVSWWIGKVIVRMGARENSLRMIFAQLSGLDSKSNIGDHL